MKTPTDLKILNAIYKEYLDTYLSFEKDADPERKAKNFVPVDLNKIGERLGVESNIIFGRLYYHMENEYGYSRDGARIHFFALRIDKSDGIHCINFPYMVSVLASLKNENNKFITSMWLSIAAIVVSVAALTVSIVKP